MAWSISLLNNTVELDSEPAMAELVKTFPHDEFADGYRGPTDGALLFNGDDMEHMDYLSNPKVREVIAKHGATGEVTFADVESGESFWGYDFCNGAVTLLKGKIVWEAV